MFVASSSTALKTNVSEDACSASTSTCKSILFNNNSNNGVTLNVRCVEFAGVCLDLRHVKFSTSGANCDREYIIFLNVKRAIYRNFKITSDMSLETLALYIYQNVLYTVDGRLQSRSAVAYDCFVQNERDFNRSIVIKCGAEARIVVAAAIHFYENYHQRVSGYMDFERRWTKDVDCLYNAMDEKERAKLDREYEMQLLEFT
ncbi:ac57 [Lambdina fiscellaria nucleopolyhedrovirus]|uniref:Ac57 n=1 Tax=Lambdina fiscellaria nucleopolyhedrovirus TaxID=1642929 RepID=A0A0E3URR8_9ABAC|nr:ac57 [Lambdina fiscellaria nucleopolyhedrovirus]AKC91714.1 ac57 [Lambdina fiscellaria nucleopolyhedrovirus]